MDRRELDAEEWAILTVLSNEGRPEERTTPRIAATLQCDLDGVASALATLEREGLALSVDDPTGELVWMSTTSDA